MTLQLTEGKFYRTRDGRKAGPLTLDGFGFWPYRDRTRDLTYSRFGIWKEDGSPSEEDLVAEWTDAPEWQVTPDGPPDGIDAETMAVPGGIAWRERESEPVPVVTEVWKGGSGLWWADAAPYSSGSGGPKVVFRFYTRDGQPDTSKPITAEWVK